MDENIPKNPTAQGGYEDSFQEHSQNHENPDDSVDKLTWEQRLEMFFSKLYISGVQSWSNQDRDNVTSLIEEYHHLFALDDLELGKTDMIKHSIKLSDYTPFNVEYPLINMTR